MAKLKAYELQDQGLDTVEANEKLGFAADCRDYDLPAEALKAARRSRVRLMTNNPDKVAALESAGITVTERVSAEVEPRRASSAICERSRRKWATSSNIPTRSTADQHRAGSADCGKPGWLPLW
jgi:GTP cyclohydrolase II